MAHDVQKRETEYNKDKFYKFHRHLQLIGPVTKEFPTDSALHRELKKSIYQKILKSVTKEAARGTASREGFKLMNGTTVSMACDLVSKVLSGDENTYKRVIHDSPFSFQIPLIMGIESLLKVYTKVLVYAAQRGGKSYISMTSLRESGAKRILILTPYPSAEDSFQKIAESYESFRGWKYYNKYNFQKYDGHENAVVFLSYQYFDTKKASIKKLLNYNFSIIMDECHRTSDTRRSLKILESIKHDKIIYQSGTPYQDILNGYFKPEQVVQYDLLQMLKDDKESGHQLFANFSYRLIDNYKSLMDKFHTDFGAEGFTLEKALSKKEYAIHFLKWISSSSSIMEGSRYTLSDCLSKPKAHILMFVPHLKEANAAYQALEQLSKDSDSGFYGFKIKQISGETDTDDDFIPVMGKSDEDTLNAFLESDNRTLIISVGKATTGVTLGTLDTVLMMTSVKSAELFMQETTRPLSIYPGKTDATVYLFDTEAAIEVSKSIFQLHAGERKQSYTEYIRSLNGVINISKCNGDFTWSEISADEIIKAVRNISCKYNPETVFSGYFIDWISGLNTQQLNELSALPPADKCHGKVNINLGLGGNPNAESATITKISKGSQDVAAQDDESKVTGGMLSRAVKLMSHIDWDIVLKQPKCAEDLLKTDDSIESKLYNSLLLSAKAAVNDLIYDLEHSDQQKVIVSLSQRNGADIFTPAQLVDSLYNKAIVNHPITKDTIITDSCVRRLGTIPQILNRLMEEPSLIADFPDKLQRKEHILTHMLYVKPCIPYKDKKEKRTESDVEEDRILLKRFGVVNLYEEDTDMKFDIALINPPYGRYHLPILNKAIDHLTDDGVVECLHPARWIQDPFKETKSNWDNNGKKAYSHLKDAEYFTASNMVKVFDAGFTMDLMIGTYIHGNGGYDFANAYDPKVWSVIKKVESKMSSNIADHDDIKKKDGWRCEIKKMAVINSTCGNAECFRMISTAIVKLDGEVVFFNGKNSNGLDWTDTREANGYSKAEGSPFPHSIQFPDEQTADNFRDTCRTKWFRNFVYITKCDVNVPFSKLPFMNDYSHAWTDDELNTYFGLTPEESEWMKRDVYDYRIKDYMKYNLI
jgi:superfamily II DNA or RNA helicase